MGRMNEKARTGEYMKMLAIDGGGIRGVFAISMLREIEREYRQPISQMFDVIAGTSTGSIIAASCAIGITMDDLLHNYQQYGGKIFRKQAKVGLFKNVYNDRYLRKLLKNAFKEITLEEINKPLLIPAVDITHGNPFIHRSNYGNKETEDYHVKLWDAVLSSCSAPVYFPPNNVENKYLSIDGGLWANNPSLVCVTEAIHFFQSSLENIHILSLGTGQQKIDFTLDSNKNWGVSQWLPFHLPSLKVTPKLLDLALHLSSESVSYHCELLLKKHYFRLNADLGKEVPFDKVDSMEELIDLGKNVFQRNKENILAFLQR
jgi:uncharacterized protein